MLSSPPPVSSRLTAILFTDLVGSVDLKSRIGTPAYLPLIVRHDALFRDAMAAHGSTGAEVVDRAGDGHFALFPTASAAVRTALAFHRSVAAEPWPHGPLLVRVGIHLGELAEMTDKAGHRKVAGLAVDLGSRIMSLGTGGQTLLTRQAFDDARNFVSDESLMWLAHGPYLFKGNDDPLDVFEVGVPGVAPLTPPPDAEKAKRIVPHDVEPTLGWRPAIGLDIPNKPGWSLDRKLGEGGFGEVWLGTSRRTKESRVFKFCFDADRLRSFKRELTFFRLLKEALGDRPDVGKLYDVQLDESPFYLESEYTAGGNLAEWAEKRGGIDKIPLATRLDLVAGTADAVAAAHSVGIIHKDIKPSNILIYTDPATGEPRPRLSDFGIGVLADRSALLARNITASGFTNITEMNDSSRTGTRMYAPPESLSGRPFTVQGDVYSLGVLLYQMSVGDLRRPIGLGWEREVADPFLRADIGDCVDVDPSRRPAGAGEVAKRLLSLNDRRAEQARRDAAAAVLAASRAALANARRRRRRLAVAAAVMFVITAVSVAVAALALNLKRAADRQRALAVAARSDADANAHRADLNAHRAEAAQQAAETNAREAKAEKAVADANAFATNRRFAEAQLAEADALTLANEIGPGRGKMESAFDLLANLHLPTINAQLGLWNQDFASPPTLARFAVSNKPLCVTLFGPDDRTVICAGFDRMIRVCDAATGRIRIAFEGSGDTIGGLALSRDGRTVAAGGFDRRVQLWNVETGRLVRVLAQDDEAIASVAFSPDEQRVLSHGGGRTIKVWDTATGRLLHVLIGHEGTVTRARFSSDGKQIASGSADGTLKIWDSPTGENTCTCRGHEGQIYDVTFGHDGRTALSASQDQTVRLWDTSTGLTIRTFFGHTGTVNSVAVSPDGAMALSGSNDTTVKLWDIATGKCVRTYADTSRPVSTVAFSPDGKLGVSAGWDGAVRVWSLEDSGELHHFSGSGGVIASLSVAPDGLTVASPDRRTGIRLWDLATRHALRSLPVFGTTATTVVFALQGKSVIAGCTDGTIKQWEVATGALRRDDRCCAACVQSLAADPSGGRVLVADAGGTVKVLNASSGDIVGTLQGHVGPVFCAAFSPDGTLAASGGDDGTIKVWDAPKSRLARTLTGHNGPVTAVCFAPDGRRVISTSRDWTSRVWDLATGANVYTVGDRPNFLYALAVSPDGHTAFCGGWDGGLTAWDVESGHTWRTFRYGPAAITSLTFADSNQTVISGFDDGSIKVWDFARHPAYRDHEADERLAKSSTLGAAMAGKLGAWYAFRGRDDWAVNLLQEARSAHAHVSALTFARCNWNLGRAADARREFLRAIDEKEAPEPYLRMCLAAVEDSPATRPATQP